MFRIYLQVDDTVIYLNTLINVFTKLEVVRIKKMHPDELEFAEFAKKETQSWSYDHNSRNTTESTENGQYVGNETSYKYKRRTNIL